MFTMILGGLEAAMDTRTVRDRVRAPLIFPIWKRLYQPFARVDENPT